MHTVLYDSANQGRGYSYIIGVMATGTLPWQEGPNPVANPEPRSAVKIENAPPKDRNNQKSVNTVTSKGKPKRTSLSREWEKNRRNKFNEAINKLGEVVRAVLKANETTSDSSNEEKDTKCAKIDIIQKAILCLANYAQEKTQLRAEILALQVQLEARPVPNVNSKKDASTQVHIEIVKKNKNGKYIKVKMQKSVTKDLKQNPTCLKKNNEENVSILKLPSILPRCNPIDKKAPENNTLVVLPASPYMFPQRQVLFPTGPPTLVVIDQNLQVLNKSVPILSRNCGDITKTTMVNILPISAYSRPLSATKSKKTVKLKTNTAKKVAKKIKPDKGSLESTKNDNKSNTNQPLKENKNSATSPQITKTNVEKVAKVPEMPQPTNPREIPPKETPTHKLVDNDRHSIEKKSVEKDKLKPAMEKNDKSPCSSNTPSKSTSPVCTACTNNTITVTTNSINKTMNSETIHKTKPLNINIPLEKDKDNKLPNILEATLCDGGNARLELAEEFLAASPTAAFLMSFPLVSGNRADSPAEEPQTTTQTQNKDHKRNELVTPIQTTTATFLEKANISDSKPKISVHKITTPLDNKTNVHDKHNQATVTKALETRTSVPVTHCSVTIPSENPFLNLSMPSMITTNCTVSDSTFGLDFDCTLNKPIPSQPSSYVSNGNIFYKNDPFSTAKSTIYSTSSISSSHDFNGIGLYPCAMEKYTPKSKSEFANMDDNNLMKMGSSRLTYDIDLGWSHKGFDFVNCTTNTPTFTKDNILTTVSSTPFSSSYNPFNPEFHVPLVTSMSKKDVSNKTSSSFADTVTNFYSQPSNLWTEEPFYSNSNVGKMGNTRHQNYVPLDSTPTNSHIKQSNVKQYEVKDTSGINANSGTKSTNHSIGHQLNEKYTKKSPSKMHINWMTSEIRPMQNNSHSSQSNIKEPQKLTYNHMDSSTKRHENHESNNYFPLSMHNFPTQAVQEDFQVWPSVRPLGTTEISIDPPPINLPTLVGDLALGPHDKKKNLESTSRAMPQQDLQNCPNFFSVTQLMNRSNDNMAPRYQPPQIETTKPFSTKQNVSHYSNESSRKVVPSRVENQMPQPYVFNDSKPSHSYENMAQYSQTKTKANTKTDKSTKSQKNNYSAEALLRGGNFTQKIPDNNGNKFLPSSQKYGDFSGSQDTSIAQVSHFPPIIDYSENSYTGQQFSGTSLYNTTTNTISNSFYTNFMPGSSNLMSGNYASGPFTGEFIDYNQSAECNYSSHKYEELKMKNNPSTFLSDKVPSNYKSSRRESASKHKLECSKKETSKKYQSKRTKLNNEVEEWNDPGHVLWQNKSSSRKHSNMMSEEFPFPNYMGNQMPSQYQPDFFNSHLMPSNMQPVGHNVERFPITSRANFNLSTIFPEITMKVQ